MLRKLITILFISFILITPTQAQEEITVLIANGDVVVKKISYEEVRLIFTLTFKRWDDGAPIRVVLREDKSLVHKTFVWEFLGLTPTRYREIIDTHISSGRAKKPVIVKSDITMATQVARLPGSIGYLSDKTFITYHENETKILIVE